MKKYLTLLSFFLVFVFCTSSKAQTKTIHPPDTLKSGSIALSSQHGPLTSVRTIIQDKKGNMWLASNEGIIRYNGQTFTNITGDLSPARFFSVLEDKKGNFWFANNGLGVYYYDGKTMLHYTTKQGLLNDQVFTIYEDITGNIWFGTIGGVSRYDGHSFKNFATSGGSPAISILEDKTGKLWIGTGDNTYVYDGKTFDVFNYKGHSFRNVWSIIEDHKGNIWLGGGSGLWRFDGSTFTNLTRNSVNYVFEDKYGNIWTSGTNDKRKFAFSRYDGNSLSDKEPKITEIAQSLNLFGIFEANDGVIWFGAYDGVYRYVENTIKDFK
jgi:ligand-binding sensor domain-containing protein